MTIHIVGLGLIGSAFARVLSLRGHTVSGEDRQAAHVTYALDHQWIQRQPVNPLPYDCVLIALPVDATIIWLKDHERMLQSIPLIIDVTGIKTPLCHANPSFFQQPNYVSLHPMTGHPQSGPSMSDKVDFTNKPMLAIHASLSPQANQCLTTIIRDLACQPITWMSVEEHDTWIAYSSHLPHILAGVLASVAKPLHHVEPGPSLTQLLHLASMQPDLWANVLLHNQARLYPLIDQCIASLHMLKKGLENSTIMSWFDTFQRQDDHQ
jgi:prephenate dehydrogenase